jgi:Kdo2-lipid IVA lauroyltransferase/acyltransferase
MRIAYFAFNVVAWLISRLPFGVLYGLSDFFYIIVFYILGYRKKVVFANLHRAFPEKPEKEIKQIARKFYRNFTDIFLETLKIQNMSEKEMDKRVVFKNNALMEKYHKEGRSAFVAIGHCGNWEWFGINMARVTTFFPYAVVKQLSNPYFDQYMSMLRTSFGYNNLINFKQTYRALLKLEHQQNLIIIAADQTPTQREISFWTEFFHQQTGFFLGLEKISKALNYVVFFADFVRVKRGHYEVEFELITDDPKSTDEFQITEEYVKRLEDAIRKRPDNWLWSHRRWKHKKPDSQSA